MCRRSWCPAIFRCRLTHLGPGMGRQCAASAASTGQGLTGSAQFGNVCLGTRKLSNVTSRGHPPDPRHNRGLLRVPDNGHGPRARAFCQKQLPGAATRRSQGSRLSKRSSQASFWIPQAFGSRLVIPCHARADSAPGSWPGLTIIWSVPGVTSNAHGKPD
jgi:hypothetical protein